MTLETGIAPGSILLVDDEAQLREMIARFLRRLGHRVDAVESAREALDCLARGTYDLVITDLQMPGESGLDVLAQVHTGGRGTRAILMSGRAEATDAAAAIEHGVDRLLLKPFDLPELQLAVERALGERRSQLRAEGQRELYDAMVRHRKTESKIWVLRAAHALVTAVEAKDSHTRGHATRVTSYAMVLADTLGGFDLGSIRLAGDLHDVGKIGIPDAILNKTDVLSDEELAIVQKHTEIGRRILEPLIDDPVVIGVARWHHERWDGSGYPDGLEGEAIPLAARIVGLCDALDAMTSDRAHRDSLSWETAVEKIHRGSGKLFDPRVVEAFDQSQPRLQALHANFKRAETAS
jgi:putative two-component system response regulator